MGIFVSILAVAIVFGIKRMLDSAYGIQNCRKCKGKNTMKTNYGNSNRWDKSSSTYLVPGSNGEYRIEERTKTKHSYQQVCSNCGWTFDVSMTYKG
jgi:hypothetical protein